MKMTKVIPAALLAGLLSITCSKSEALSMQPANLGLIVEYTEKAFTGKVVSSTVVKTSQGWADEVTFEVTDPILGQVHKGGTVTWKQYRASEASPLAGMPSYQSGVEYVIFLGAKAAGSELQSPMGLGQGTFVVSRDEAGKAYARNEFRNGSLLADMDVDALATAIVDDSAGGPPANANERAIKTKDIQSKLKNRQSGAVDLQALKDAAKTLKKSGAARTKFAKKGGSPAQPLIVKNN